MGIIEQILGSGAGPFMARNLLGHEPCHDFNPAGVGKRMCLLNKVFDKVIAMIIGLDPLLSSGGGSPAAGSRLPQDGGAGGWSQDNIRQLLTNQLPPDVFDRVYGVAGLGNHVVQLAKEQAQGSGAADDQFNQLYGAKLGGDAAADVLTVVDDLSWAATEGDSTVKLSDFMNFSVAGAGDATMQTGFSALGLILASEQQLPAANAIIRRFLSRLKLDREGVAQILSSNTNMQALRQSRPDIASRIELLVEIIQAIAEVSAYSRIIPLSLLTNGPPSSAESTGFEEDMGGGTKTVLGDRSNTPLRPRVKASLAAIDKRAGPKKPLATVANPEVIPRKPLPTKRSYWDSRTAAPRRVRKAINFNDDDDTDEEVSGEDSLAGVAQAADPMLAQAQAQAQADLEARIVQASNGTDVFKTADMYSQFDQASQFLVGQFEEIERIFQGISRGENLQAYSPQLISPEDALAAALSMKQDEDSRTPRNTQRIQPSLVFRAINQLVSAFRNGQLQSISPVGPFFASNCDFVCNGMMLFFMDILSVEPGQQALPFFDGAGTIAEELWLLSQGQPASSGVLEPLPAGQAVNVQLSDDRGVARAVPVDLADLESCLQVHELLVDKIDRAIATEGLNAVIPPGAADKYGHMREMINKRKAMMQGGMRGGARKQAYGTFQGMLAEYTTGSSPLLPGSSAEAMALMKLPVLRVATGEMPGPNIPEPMRIALTSNPGSPDIAQLPAYLANQSLQEWPGASTLPVWVEGENQDRLFSFYTPDMIYYINRAMLFYLGKWPDAPPDAPEGWLKDRKLHRGAGGECERCKDLIRDQLATVIIPRLFLLFEGMVTGAGERVVENPNVAPAWDALKGPLQTTMIASVIRDMNALSINTFLGGMGKTITSDVTGSDGKVMEQCPPIVELNRRVISKIQAVFFKLNTATKAKAADHPLAKGLKAIPMEEAAKAVSQPLRNFTNQLLKEQCRRIQEDLVKLDGIPLNADNKPSKAESDGYWGPAKLWYAQGMIIDKVAQGKGIGDIDERLLKQFLEATMSSATVPTSFAPQPWMKWSDKVGLARGLSTTAAVWELVTYKLTT